MSSDQENALITTTSKIILQEWEAFSEICLDITQTGLAKKNKTKSTLGLLSDTQLKDAFQGPFHTWLQALCNQFVLLSKVRAHLTITNDDNLKPHIKDRDMALPTLQNPNINIAAIDKMQSQLDTVARKHFAEWQQRLEEWNESFALQFMANGINLSELEIENLSDYETLSELLNQFTELNLEIPNSKLKQYSFYDYFRLKLTLCLHSALSRQHQPHDTTAIEKNLKKFKTELKKLSSEEKSLNKLFCGQIKALIKI